MPRKILLFLLVSVALSSISAQQSLLRLEILQGANKSFVGDAAEGKHLGPSAGYGVSYFYRKKKSAISFEPQIIVPINNYIFHINHDCDLQIRQRVLSFMPMAGILVAKNITLKTGFFINTSEVSKLSLVYYQGPTTTVGTDNWNYYPNRIQAGFLVGMSAGLGQKKMWNFNLLLEQFANAIIEKDIELQGVTFKEPYNSVFSRKCKPTLILLGLSYVVKKFERDKNAHDLEL
jgi:hypothetical protein